MFCGLLLAATSLSGAQEPRPQGLQLSGLPALNYNSDEGFGYGLVAGLYNHGTGDRKPYVWSFEPLVFFTTQGRREVSAVFDAPYILDGAARLTAFAGFLRDCCQPYYGLGHETTYELGLATPATGPNYYTYGRERWSAVLDLQWRVTPALRVLTGFAAHRNEGTARQGSTLFDREQLDGSATSLGPKVGLVWDTRDQERDPREGLWADLLVWQGMAFLGGDHAFTRITATVRHYTTISSKLTFAARFLVEHVAGDMPVTMLPDIGSSFRDVSGLGGANTVRGVLRDRFLGSTRLLMNYELRWRGVPFRVLGQRWRAGGVVFSDGGRVWAAGDGFSITDIGDLHNGSGAGLRLVWGEAFIIAFDLAHGDEAGLQMYLGLGQLF